MLSFPPCYYPLLPTSPSFSLLSSLPLLSFILFSYSSILFCSLLSHFFHSVLRLFVLPSTSSLPSDSPFLSPTSPFLTDHFFPPSCYSFSLSHLLLLSSLPPHFSSSLRIFLQSSVLLTLLPTKAPLVFLDVGTELRVLGRVYISLWGHLRRAMNFLHLCLGDRGPSFRDSMFLEVTNADFPGERIRGGDYECNNGRGGEALLDDLETEEGYSTPMEAGMVTAAGPNRKEVDSQFFICTEDDFDRRFACPFGRVVSGLPVMKEAVWLVMTKEIYIRDCGVVVEAPRL